MLTGLDPTDVVVALVALVGILYTARVNNQANKASEKQRAESARLERDKVSQDAYQRAREADQETIRSLRAELESTRTLRREDLQAAQRDLDRLERQVEALRADLSQEQQENVRLREHIDRLERTIVQLRARLGAAGLVDDRRPQERTDGD